MATVKLRGAYSTLVKTGLIEVERHVFHPLDLPPLASLLLHCQRHSFSSGHLNGVHFRVLLSYFHLSKIFKNQGDLVYFWRCSHMLSKEGKQEERTKNFY